MDLSSWALPQLSSLLPLDDDSLKQIINYSESLPPKDAAEHLQNLLGDSPQALEFITSFNNRRKPSLQGTASASAAKNDVSGVPKPKGRKKKAGPAIGKPPPRRPENYGDTAGAYIKKDEDDYMSSSAKPARQAKSSTSALNDKPDATQKPTASSSSTTTNPVVPRPSSKPPPSAAGPLISDLKPSRTSSPKPQAKAKVKITGGTPMHGASSELNDLESAIRALEISTNPTLSQDNAKRKCNCMATRHPLLQAAPNCINCGKIICVKEGIGPCTFCNKPLLSASDVQSMVRILREERGKEKMAANNAGQKKAEVSQAPRPFSTPKGTTPASSNPPSDSEAEGLAKAKAHRDRLLAFQAQNAQRTRVHDEAADFETPDAGLSMWATPQERAMQLKRQQKALREQEWNARPEYEKRKMVASIDLVGGKIVKRMAAVDRPQTPESDDDTPDLVEQPQGSGSTSGNGGAFSRNPLLGGLIRPVYKPKGGKGEEPGEEQKSSWRRVQDDLDDNEQWILDGGVTGGTQGWEQDGCG